MTRASILIVQRSREASPALTAALARLGCRVTIASPTGDLMAASSQCSPDIGIIESDPEARWLEIASALRRANPLISLILLAVNSTQALAIEALRAGFEDYVLAPCDSREVLAAVRRCRARETPMCHTASRPAEPAPALALVGGSEATSQVREQVSKLGPTEGNVLITGETGTGKELVAELIHAASPRCARPFVSVNCAAVPDTLLESELFGYERGAFTSADVATAGRLEEAHGGTVFLDEIGDMTPAGQAKILRVTDGKDWSRLGGRRQIHADLRFVAATNQDLDALIANGRFRRDLYFRLNVARVELLPLRDRREDVPVLLDHYIREFNRRLGCAVEGLTDEALAALTGYDWPGNVRELRNVVETMFVGHPSGRLGVDALPARMRHCLSGLPAVDAERQRLLGALTATRWNKSKAAAQLHWSRMTLYRKMVKYGVTNGAA